MASKTSSNNSNTKGKASGLDALTFGDVKGAEKVSFGFGPTWAPHLSELSDKSRDEKLAKLGAGSSYRPDLRGVLNVAKAFEGSASERDLYHLSVEVAPGETVNVRLPEHTMLYGPLGFVPIGETVKAVYTGRGPSGGKTRDGKPKSAPHVYDVTCANALKTARADALKVVFKETDDDGSF